MMQAVEKKNQKPEENYSLWLSRWFVSPWLSSWSDTLATKSFKLGKLLGTGIHSKVYSAHSPDSQQFAVKLFRISDLDQAQMQTLEHESRILQDLNHPQIVRTHGIFRTTCRTHIAIQMELCRYGDLFEHVNQRGTLPESDVFSILSQVANALHYLHTRGIFHRDLKLENILLRSIDPLQVCLADFGLASKKTGPLHTRCGSEEYVAPEIIRGLPYDGRSSDAWSLGIIAYACCFGRLPFSSPTPKTLYDRICNGIYKFPDIEISSEMNSLIRGLLSIRPEERLSIETLL